MANLVYKQKLADKALQVSGAITEEELFGCIGLLEAFAYDIRGNRANLDNLPKEANTDEIVYIKRIISAYMLLRAADRLTEELDRIAKRGAAYECTLSAERVQRAREIFHKKIKEFADTGRFSVSTAPDKGTFPFHMRASRDMKGTHCSALVTSDDD